MSRSEGLWSTASWMSTSDRRRPNSGRAVPALKTRRGSKWLLLSGGDSGIRGNFLGSL